MRAVVQVTAAYTIRSLSSFETWSDVIKFRSCSDNTGRIIEDESKAISLSGREIE